MESPQEKAARPIGGTPLIISLLSLVRDRRERERERRFISWNWDHSPKHLGNQGYSFLAGRSYSTHCEMSQDSNMLVPGHIMMDMLWLDRWMYISCGNGHSEWCMGSALLDCMLISNTPPALVSKWCWECSSWIHAVWTYRLLPDTMVSQTGCPFALKPLLPAWWPWCCHHNQPMWDSCSQYCTEVQLPQTQRRMGLFDLLMHHTPS